MCTPKGFVCKACTATHARHATIFWCLGLSMHQSGKNNKPKPKKGSEKEKRKKKKRKKKSPTQHAHKHAFKSPPTSAAPPCPLCLLSLLSLLLLLYLLFLAECLCWPLPFALSCFFFFGCRKHYPLTRFRWVLSFFPCLLLHSHTKHKQNSTRYKRCTAV